MDIEFLTVQYLDALSNDLATIRIYEPKDSPSILLRDVFISLTTRKHEPPHSYLRPSDDLPNKKFPKLRPSAFELKNSAPAEESKHFSLGETIKNNRYLVLLGEPGAGKSTIMQFTCLCFANQKFGWAKQHLDIEQTFVPVLLNLQETVLFFNNQENLLMDALKREVSSRLQETQLIAEILLHEWSKKGQLLILLDGLDETRGQRDNVIQQTRNFVNSPIGKGAHLMLTSRIVGYGTLEDPFRDFVIDFLSPEKSENFLQNWFHMLRKEWSETICIAKAKDLQRKLLLQPSLRRLLENPLNLRLIAEIFSINEYIPHSRAELYRVCIEETWNRSIKRGAQSEAKQRVLTAIQALAWHNHTGGIGGETDALVALQAARTLEDADNLLHAARIHTGLVSYVQNRYIFNHATFQEYFVAERLKASWLLNSKSTWKFLRPRLHLPEWREPIMLLSDSLDSSSASKLFRNVWRARSSIFEGILLRDFFLLVDMLYERSSQDLLSLRKRVNWNLKLLLEAKNLRLQELAMNALSRAGDPIAKKKLEEELFAVMRTFTAFKVKLPETAGALPSRRLVMERMKRQTDMVTKKGAYLNLMLAEALIDDRFTKEYVKLDKEKQKNAISRIQSLCWYLATHDYYDELNLIVNRLEQLKSYSAELKDPLQQQPTKLKRFINRFALVFLTIMLLTILGLLGILFSKTQDSLKEQLDWLNQQSTTLLIILAVGILVFISFISIIIDWLKDRLQEK